MKIGFIGFGRVVEWHLNCLMSIPSLRVSFVCDQLQDRQFKAKELLPDALIYSSLDELLRCSACQSVDYIVIATPTGSHYEIAKHLLKETDSCLLIEKPTFLRLSDFVDLSSCADRIIPIFQNRFNPAVIRAAQILRSLDCEVSHASLSVDWSRPQRYYDLADWRGTWHSDGGVSTNQGIHYFDIARTLLGDFKNVRCSMKRRIANIECEDYLSAFIELESGVPLDVRMTTTLRHNQERASLSIHTPKGSICIGGICCNELTFLSDKCEDPGSFNIKEKVYTPYGNGHKALYDQLSKNNLGKISTLGQSKETMKYIHACYDSAITGQVVSSDALFSSSPLGKRPLSPVNFI